MPASDLIIRATGTKAPFRFVLVDLTQVANGIGKAHGARAHALSLLAECSIASLLLSSGLKFAGTVSLQVAFSGDVTVVQADSTPTGLVRAMLPQDEIQAAGDFELLLSPQRLRVRRLGEQGQLIQESIVEAASTSMSQNLAAFLMQSEQVKSGVGIFTRPNADDDSKLDYAVGFMVEAFPGAKEEHLDLLDLIIRELPEISTLLKPEGFSLPDLLYQLSGPFETEIIREIVPHAYCPCSQERTIATIATLPLPELINLQAEAATLDVTCDFCRTHYEITPQDLTEIIAQRRGKQQ